MRKLSVGNEEAHKEAHKEAVGCGGHNCLGKLLVIMAVGIFVVSLILSLWILRPSKEQLVEVVSDGEVLYSLDLSDTEDTELVVTYGGSSNIIRIENGEIWVREADCPDQTCVEMGKLYSESLPIVCLPNHLIIRFAE